MVGFNEWDTRGICPQVGPNQWDCPTGLIKPMDFSTGWVQLLGYTHWLSSASGTFPTGEIFPLIGFNLWGVFHCTDVVWLSRWDVFHELDPTVSFFSTEGFNYCVFFYWLDPTGGGFPFVALQTVASFHWLGSTRGISSTCWMHLVEFLPLGFSTCWVHEVGFLPLVGRN